MAEQAIIVGYDGSDAAERALDRAIEEARTRHARVVVLAVVEMLLNPEGPQNFGSVSDTPEMIPLEEPEEVTQLFARARARIEAARVPAELEWVAGEPAGEIVAAAADRKASLIVVGHRHHGMLGRFFGTDVSEEVTKEAGCEVIVVD
jgi:nucleotide-binding universal stress UspA family protein